MEFDCRREAALKHEQELIERNMYYEMVRLRDIRIELDEMPPDPSIRMDG